MMMMDHYGNTCTYQATRYNNIIIIVKKEKEKIIIIKKDKKRCLIVEITVGGDPS